MGSNDTDRPACAESVEEKGNLHELLRVYQDLEKTLRSLKRVAQESGASPIKQINISRLIHQLSVSKRKLERKINNTLLLEKEELKRGLRRFLRRRVTTA